MIHIELFNKLNKKLHSIYNTNKILSEYKKNITNVVAFARKKTVFSSELSAISLNMAYALLLFDWKV